MFFFDNCSSTKPTMEALKDFNDNSIEYYENPGGISKTSKTIMEKMNASKSRIIEAAGLSVEDYFFISTCTASEANNMILKQIVNSKNMKIVTTELEHSSVNKTIEYLVEKYKVEVFYVPINKETMTIDYNKLETLIKENNPDLVSIIQVDNELGIKNDIPKIVSIVKDNCTAKLHIDGVQGYSKIKEDLNGIDYYSISGHKIKSIKGIAGIIAREGNSVYKLVHGGAQEHNFRAGTENFPALISFSNQAKRNVDLREINTKKALEIKEYMINTLVNLGGYNINSKLDKSSPFILNISVIGYPTQLIVPYLEENGIILSGLSTCSIKTNTPNKLTKIGFDANIANSSIRICIDTNNDLEQAKVLIEKLEQLKKTFKKIELSSQIKIKENEGYDQIIDVREYSEAKENPIPNSENIPLFELLSKPEKHINKNCKYCIVCQTGKRADIAVKILDSKGYKNIQIKGE